MNVRELDAEYKLRFAELTEKLGHTPTVSDKEYWDLTEWHKSQYHPEPKDVFDEPVEEYKPSKSTSKPKTVVAKQSDRTVECRKCNAPFERPAKRGRPPVYCEKCR